jgi:phospholipase C
MLFITYDEHGGFYDHFPTPLHVPNPDDKCNWENTFCFDRLGVRVPTIAVSPWIRKGTIVHGPPEGVHKPTPTSEFEHSSVSATLKRMWNLTSDFLTKRDAWAGTFDFIITDQYRDDCPLTAPDLPDPDPSLVTPHGIIDELQRDFVWMSAGVNGDENELNDEILGKMTEIEADLYMKKKMTKWMGRCPYAGTPDSYEGCEEYDNKINK